MIDLKRREKMLLIYTIIILSIEIIGISCARVIPKVRLTYGPQEAKWVEKTMKKMTLEEKVGQMLAWRFSGDFVNRQSEYFKELEELVVKYKIGGLILFGGEVYETAYLTNSLQALTKIPLLFASDFERGAGNQISGATLFPPLMALGATNSEDLAYIMGKLTALEGRAMGIHMTYAPVVDVNINPENPIINTRSVGEDPALVSRLAQAFIRGCQDNGLIATAKHFPGHGDTDLDSHLQLAIVRADRERLEKVELYPFKKAIEAGVQAIMTAHMYVPALDPTPDLPATLSPAILTDLLRKKLGFKGLIVSDAMTMGGVTTLYSVEEAAVKAVMAGVDMLLLPPSPQRAIQALIEAVRSGKISEARVNEAVKRILEVKAKLGLNQNRFVDVAALAYKIAPKEYLDQAQLVFDGAITLVKNNGGTVPLSCTDKKIAVFSLSSDLGDYYAGRAFSDALRKRCPQALVFYADADTGKEHLEEAAAKAREADIIIFALFSSLRAHKGSVDLDPKHVEIVKGFARGEKPVVAISFGSPYFFKHFPEIDVYICAYRNAAQAQIAVCKVLFGEIPVKGRLPVSLPGYYTSGHGIFLEKKE